MSTSMVMSLPSESRLSNTSPSQKAILKQLDTKRKQLSRTRGKNGRHGKSYYVQVCLDLTLNLSLAAGCCISTLLQNNSFGKSWHDHARQASNGPTVLKIWRPKDLNCTPELARLKKITNTTCSFTTCDAVPGVLRTAQALVVGCGL